MITCRNIEDYEILKSLRAHGWSRGLKKEKKIAKHNSHLDSRFIFYNSGFNLRPTDIAASIGLSQFKDLDNFTLIRNKNRNLIVNSLKKRKKIQNNFHFIEANKNVKPSWFGIPILINKKNNRKRIIKKLESNGVETRPIISGNFIKQPAVKKYKLLAGKKFINSDKINNQGFFIGLPTRKINNNYVNRIVKAFEKSI